jgi:hypothetical protein
MVPSAMAEKLTAHQIAIKSDEVDDGETQTSDMTMILIDRRGKQRVRQIKAFRKDYGEDTKSISFFLSPADVRNTGFLSFEWDDPDREDDNWLYLPALQKVKRISAGNKKDSFMGSDFSYADMNGMEVTEWDHKMLKENAKVDGFDCWIIQGTPRKDIAKKVIDETGYLKSIVWVRKDNFKVVQGKFWVKEGRKIKFLKISGLKKIQGIWTAEKLEMITTKRKRKEHATVLLFNNIVYNKGVEDDMFTTQRIERGL